jgi:hypothetical protein
MKTIFALMTSLITISILGAGCSVPGTPASLPDGTGEGVNFRLLLSDEVNAINDFSSLNVTVSQIGLLRSGESSNWTNYDLNPPKTEDLTELLGDNATELWSGNITPGEYNKVFIYVDEVVGILAKGGDTATVRLPSGKLQISKPFIVTESGGNLTVNFVFDIAVIEAGQSGKYILKPQIAQSGAGQKFKEVKTQQGQAQSKKENRAGKPDKELELKLEGEPGLGEEVTLVVSYNGSPVEGATVRVNGEKLSEKTDENGNLSIVLPDNPGEVEIEAIFQGKEGEMEIELEAES